MLSVALIGAVLWLCRTTSGECDTGRFYLGSVNESYPELLASSGVYILQPGLRHVAREVYRHESGAFYMYRPRGAAGKVLCPWVVSPNISNDLQDVTVCLRSKQRQPSLSAEQVWFVKTASGGWEEHRELKTTCVDENFGVCTSGTIEISGISDASRAQSKFAGTYRLQQFTSYLRPVYKKEDGVGYLLYGGTWMIKSSLNTSHISLFVSDYAFRPELITNAWWVFSGYFFRPVQIKIKCVVKELKTDTTPGYYQSYGSTEEGITQSSGSTEDKGTTTQDPETVTTGSTTTATTDHGQSTTGESKLPRNEITTQTLSLQALSQEPEVTITEASSTTYGSTDTNAPSLSSRANHMIEKDSVFPLAAGSEVSEDDPVTKTMAAFRPSCSNGGHPVIGTLGGSRLCQCPIGYFGTLCRQEIRCGEPPALPGATIHSVTGSHVFSLVFYVCSSSGRRCAAVCSPAGRWESQPGCQRLYEPSLMGETSLLHSGRR